MFHIFKPKTGVRGFEVRHLKACTAGCDQGVGDKSQRLTLSNCLGEYYRPSAPFALK